MLVYEMDKQYICYTKYFHFNFEVYGKIFSSERHRAHILHQLKKDIE